MPYNNTQAFGGRQANFQRPGMWGGGHMGGLLPPQGMPQPQGMPMPPQGGLQGLAPNMPPPPPPQPQAAPVVPTNAMPSAQVLQNYNLGARGRGLQTNQYQGTIPIPYAQALSAGLLRR